MIAAKYLVPILKSTKLFNPRKHNFNIKKELQFYFNLTFEESTEGNPISHAFYI
mgnify:CR=1 FL=1